jgi:sulfate adenylyltransferase
MSNLVPPHGADSLKPLLLPETERAEEAKRAERLKQVPLSSREVSDLLMLGMGAYTPLDGFMGEADWHGCCEHMTLSNGIFWPIPITLSCAQDLGDSISIGEDVALVDGESSELLGILTVEEKYGIDREFECSHVFRTTDTAHPGADKVMQQGPVNLGGPVRTLSEGYFPETYAGFYHRPAETRALFQERGWSKVAAFQTRNPMHRSHEHLAKIAIEICDGVLIHRRPETRRYSGRGAGQGDRCPRQQLFCTRHHPAGGLPDRDALRGPAGSAAARGIAAEFRLFAPDRWTRPCRCR